MVIRRGLVRMVTAPARKLTAASVRLGALRAVRHSQYVAKRFQLRRAW
jgi:hypothetical protein